MTTPRQRLGDVAQINPRPSRFPQPDEMVSFAGMADLDSQQGSITQSILRPFSEVCKGYTPFQARDILVAKITPCFENCKIGEASIPLDVGYGSTEFHVIRPLATRLDRRYVLHFLRQEKVLKAGERRMTGSAGQKRVPVSFLEELEIPLPPLEEQRRIAAILDKCHDTELLATKATSLYAGLFEASFHSFLRQVEDRQTIPQVPLSSVCTRITKGTTPSSLGLPDAEGDIPFVRVQDIENNVLISESVALQIPMETHHALSRSILQSGDILVSIAGTIGRVCEVRSLPPHGANCNQAVAITRPIPDVVRPLFLKCLLSDRPAQKQMRGAGVTGTITNLSLGQLGEIKIPVPSIEAQDRICDQLERLADIGERFQNSFVTAKRLSDSLTSFLMSGT